MARDLCALSWRSWFPGLSLLTGWTSDLLFDFLREFWGSSKGIIRNMSVPFKHVNRGLSSRCLSNDGCGYFSGLSFLRVWLNPHPRFVLLNFVRTFLPTFISNLGPRCFHDILRRHPKPAHDIAIWGVVWALFMSDICAILSEYKGSHCSADGFRLFVGSHLNFEIMLDVYEALVFISCVVGCRGVIFVASFSSDLGFSNSYGFNRDPFFIGFFIIRFFPLRFLFTLLSFLSKAFAFSVV